MTSIKQCQFGLKHAAQEIINNYDANRHIIEASFPPELSSKIKKGINGTIRHYAKAGGSPQVIPHSAFPTKIKKNNPKKFNGNKYN